MDHYRNFCTVNTSTGRALEASSVYSIAAYSARDSRILSALVVTVVSNVCRVQSEADCNLFRRLGTSMSHIKIPTVGICDLTASKAEVLCIHQRSAGVAQTRSNLFIYPHATFSAARIHALRRQLIQSVRYAAQLAVRGRVCEAPSPLLGTESQPRSGRGWGRVGGSIGIYRGSGRVQRK